MTDHSTASSHATNHWDSETKEAMILKNALEKKTDKGKKKKKRSYLNSDEEAVNTIVQQAFDSIIGKDPYYPLKTTGWISKLVQEISKQLLDRKETRKFIVHCTLNSKSDELSICTANMCSWNTSKDVVVYTEWISKTVFGAVQVFFITHKTSN